MGSIPTSSSSARVLPVQARGGLVGPLSLENSVSAAFRMRSALGLGAFFGTPKRYGRSWVPINEKTNVRFFFWKPGVIPCTCQRAPARCPSGMLRACSVIALLAVATFAHADEIPIVTLTDTGPNQDVPVHRAFYVAGEATAGVSSTRTARRRPASRRR